MKRYYNVATQCKSDSQARRGLTSSEPLAEVQRALLVVLVLHAPHPEAGGLLGLRKLREHYMSSWDNPLSYIALLCFLLRLAFAHRPARPWAAAAIAPPTPPPTGGVCATVGLAKGHDTKGQSV